MTNLSLLSDKSEHVVTSLRLVRDKSEPLASQTHCVSLTSLSSTAYVATGWSPSKCRCNNGLCLSSLQVSACTPTKIYICIKGAAIVSYKTFTPIARRASSQKSGPGGPVDFYIEIFGLKRFIHQQLKLCRYLGGSSSTTGLQHLYTVPVQFYSTNWN